MLRTLNSYHTVPPRSDELKNLLTDKQEKNNYGSQGRTAESWRGAMDESWIKVKVERYRPEAGEEEKWKDPLQVDFGSPGQDKGEAWLDFVLRHVASRRPKETEPNIDANVLVKPITKMSFGGPAPNLPEPTVPVIPSEFKDDQEETPEAREQRMVHDVYETIAPHFSQTRYKPWPIIARFLSSIPEHSIGLDSGAGNGKYLPVVREGSKGSRMIALDRSSGLLSVARAQKGEIGDDVIGGVEECVRGDLAFDGWRKGVFVSRTVFGHDLSINSSKLLNDRRTLPSPSRRCITSRPDRDEYNPYARFCSHFTSRPLPLTPSSSSTSGHTNKERIVNARWACWRVPLRMMMKPLDRTLMVRRGRRTRMYWFLGYCRVRRRKRSNSHDREKQNPSRTEERPMRWATPAQEGRRHLPP